MKHTRSITALTALLCCALLTGCGKTTADPVDTPLQVFSFSGENEQLSITNGVIVLSAEQDVFSGGELTVKDESLHHCTAFVETFSLRSAGEEITLSSNAARDTTGGTVTTGGELGKCFGGKGLLGQASTDDLKQTLYFELTTTDAEGNETVSQLHLEVTEVTEPLER